jgi:hypothetical protein
MKLNIQNSIGTNEGSDHALGARKLSNFECRVVQLSPSTSPQIGLSTFEGCLNYKFRALMQLPNRQIAQTGQLCDDCAPLKTATRVLQSSGMCVCVVRVA